MKTITEKSRISNLYAYLKKTDADVVVVITSLVSGGWHDNEFDAHAAGFEIVRFQNPELAAQHKFSECYKFTRR